MNAWGPALPGNGIPPAFVSRVVFSRRPIEANGDNAEPVGEEIEMQARAPPPLPPTGTPDEIVLLKPSTPTRQVYYRPRAIGLGDMEPLAQAEIWAISRVIYAEMRQRGMPTMVYFLQGGNARRQLADRTQPNRIERSRHYMEANRMQTLTVAGIGLPGALLSRTRGSKRAPT